MHRRKVGFLAHQLVYLRAFPDCLAGSIDGMACTGPVFRRGRGKEESPSFGFLRIYESFILSLAAERRLTVLDACMTPARHFRPLLGMDTTQPMKSRPNEYDTRGGVCSRSVEARVRQEAQGKHSVGYNIR